MTGAEMIADTMIGLTGWASADEQTRIKALIAARDKIASLLLRDGSSSDKDLAGYGFYSSGAFRLADLTVSEWDSTSASLKHAVRQAQVAQANWFLDPQSAQQDNVRSIVIGESSRTFFQGPKIPLAPQAMRILGRFLAPARVVRG